MLLQETAEPLPGREEPIHPQQIVHRQETDVAVVLRVEPRQVVLGHPRAEGRGLLEALPRPLALSQLVEDDAELLIDLGLLTVQLQRPGEPHRGLLQPPGGVEDTGLQVQHQRPLLLLGQPRQLRHGRVGAPLGQVGPRAGQRLDEIRGEGASRRVLPILGGGPTGVLGDELLDRPPEPERLPAVRALGRVLQEDLQVAERTVQIPRPPERPGQGQVRRGPVRPDLQRPREVEGGLREVPVGLVREVELPQPEVDIGVAAVEGQRPQVRELRRLDVPLAPQEVAELEVRRRELGGDGQGLLEQTSRLLGVPAGRQALSLGHQLSGLLRDRLLPSEPAELLGLTLHLNLPDPAGGLLAPLPPVVHPLIPLERLVRLPRLPEEIPDLHQHLVAGLPGPDILLVIPLGLGIALPEARHTGLTQDDGRLVPVELPDLLQDVRGLGQAFLRRPLPPQQIGQVHVGDEPRRI